MTTPIHRRAALAGLGALAAAPAFAQQRTIKALLGWPPGGSSDIVARTLPSACGRR